MDKVLIIGSQGGLGSTFMKMLREMNAAVRGLSHAEGDVTRADLLATAIAAYGPGLVINASGYTAVDLAESEKEKAYAVNARGVENIVQACRKIGAVLLTFSTDYVFSGEKRPRAWTETDAPHPAGVYGRTKLEGERFALAYDNSLVLRTSWLYSDSGKSFPKTILTKAKNGEPLKIVSDQVASPTYAPDLVAASLKLLETRQRGLFHFASSGETNWFEFASKAIEIYNQQTGKKLAAPSPIQTKDLSLKAPRPAYSMLDSSKAQGAGATPRPWPQGLAEFVRSGLENGSL